MIGFLCCNIVGGRLATLALSEGEKASPPWRWTDEGPSYLLGAPSAAAVTFSYLTAFARFAVCFRSRDKRLPGIATLAKRGGIEKSGLRCRVVIFYGDRG